MADFEPVDAIAPAAYLVAIIAVRWHWRLRKSSTEEFLLGGRRFGRLVQTFASFGQSSTPDSLVGVATATFYNGISGVWASLLMVFATPILWLVAPWMRRMRVVTMADFYMERYGSAKLAATYAVIASLGMINILSAGNIAVAKTVIAVTGAPWPLHLVIWSVCGLTLLNGAVGGLTATFYATFVEGVAVLAMSFLLVVLGFARLGGASALPSRLPTDFFQVFGSERLPDYTWYYIGAVSLVAGVSVVTQPQFMITNAAAKDEASARFGIVTGTLLKRMCTIVWAVIGLIGAALFSNRLTDPDMVWGSTARQLFAPLKLGLVGLMIAGMLATLAAVTNSLILTVSGLLTQNVYRRLRPSESDSHYLRFGRFVAVLSVVGGAAIASEFDSLFALLKLNWEYFVIFTAAFWLGQKWRRANAPSAWASILVTFLCLYVIPQLLPLAVPSMRTSPILLETTRAGNESLYWSQGIERDEGGHLFGKGYPYFEMIALRAIGIDLPAHGNALNETIRLSIRLGLPFIVLFIVALSTRPDDPRLIGRFFTRMRTPVTSSAETAETKAAQLELLWPNSNWEFYRWTRGDVFSFSITIGFVLSIIALLEGTARFLR
jgi:Na+/proline symporter